MAFNSNDFLPAVASGLSGSPPAAPPQPPSSWDPPGLRRPRWPAPLGPPSAPSSPCRSVCPSADAAPAARPEQPAASPRPGCGLPRLQRSSSPHKTPSCSACWREASGHIQKPNAVIETSSLRPRSSQDNRFLSYCLAAAAAAAAVDLFGF